MPGGGELAGGRVVCSPEGLPGEVEGVGAVPVGPGEGGGAGIAAVNDGTLRARLGRMLWNGAEMSPEPYTK